MKFKTFIIVFLFFLNCSYSFASEATQSKISEIFVPKPESDTDIRPRYPYELLNRVLAVTESKYGKAIIKETPIQAVQKRYRKLLNSKDIDVLWAVTSKERENEIEPIRVPIAKGLFGVRVCIIKKGNESKFENIHSLEDWKRKNLTIIQGHDWSSTEIFRTSNLSVFTATSYDQLFVMVSQGEGDCFSRSVVEAYDEIKTQLKSNSQIGTQLTIDKRILFHYPAAFYFFVRKGNLQLKTRIEEGLNILKSNHQFEDLFNKYYKDVLDLADLKNRVVIELSNLNLPELTPLSNKEYWLEVGK